MIGLVHDPVASPSAVLRRRWWLPGLRDSSLVAAAVVWLVYGVWIVGFLARGHDPRDFADLGKTFVEQSHVSSVITVDPSYHYPADISGFDGQFVYYIAVDPLNARYYMDAPNYRYTRILYPLLGRLLGLANPQLIPYSLIAISWLAIGGATFILARWLVAKGLPAALALIYGLFPGLFISLRFDLTEALSFALVVGAICLFDFGPRPRYLLAGAAFGLATLARETAGLFALIYAGAVLLDDARATGWKPAVRRNWRRTATMLVIALVPAAAYKAFLTVWLGGFNQGRNPSFEPIPFAGILSYWPWQFRQLEEIVVVIVPGVLCGALAVWALASRLWSKEIAVLLSQVLLFIVFIHPANIPDLTDLGRYTIGIVLGAILCIPIFDRLTQGRRLWLLVAAPMWLVITPWYLAKPFLTRGG